MVPSPDRWQVLFCPPPQQHAIQASITHPPSHTHTHSPGSKTGLFYLIFLREISVSLASSNFSLFITQKTAKKHYAAQMCLSSSSVSPSILPFPPSLLPSFLPIIPLLQTGPFLSRARSHETPGKSEKIIRCAISQYFLS